MSRVRPHVDQVDDWAAQQSLSLLWDRVFAIDGKVTAQQTLIDAQATTLQQQAALITDLQRQVTRVSVSPTAASATLDPDQALNIIDAGAVSGPFAEGPTAINFPPLGIVQVYSSPDVSGWTETSVLSSVSFATGTLTVNYSTLAAWLPGVTIGPGTLQEATIWIFLQITGTWYGAGGERLRPNQTTKSIPAYSAIPTSWFYDPRWGPMSTYTPTPGSNAAMMVTAGSTRVDNRTLYTERSNIIQFAWPADGTSVTFT